MINISSSSIKQELSIIILTNINYFSIFAKIYNLKVMSSNTLIIIPCYNEEKRLPVDKFNKYFIENKDIKFLFVNDGSKDNTISVLNHLKGENTNVYVLNNLQNGGKAFAIQDAVKYALQNIDFEYIGFFDADLATPLFEIKNLKKFAIENDYLMTVCSRISRMGSHIDRNMARHIMGRFFATFTSRLLMLPVYDTQCGAKIIRKDVAEIIFKEPFNSKWFFDIELYARTILYFGYEKAIHGIYEYPMLEWIEQGDSRIKLKDIIKTPIELLKLNKIYHKKIAAIAQKENYIYSPPY